MKRKVLSKVGKTTNNSDSDFDVLPMFPLDKPNRLQVKETTFNTYDYKLFGEIKGVEDYFDLIDALNYASPDDEFIIRIHSGGGSLGTADVIINAIQNTPARVHGYIESLCGSASTIIGNSFTTSLIASPICIPSLGSTVISVGTSYSFPTSFIVSEFSAFAPKFIVPLFNIVEFGFISIPVLFCPFTFIIPWLFNIEFLFK